MANNQSRHETPASIPQLHAQFLNLLPTIKKYAQYHFRSIPCTHRQADALAEAIALCWKWFVGLARRGRDAAEFPTVLAGFAARAVRNGRRLAGQERAGDVFSPVAQRRGNFAAVAFIDQSCSGVSVLGPALRDNVMTPIPDQVQFRCDFPAWRGQLSEAKQQMVDQLALGHRTQDVARTVGLSAARISQLRRELHDDYERFCSGEASD